MRRAKPKNRNELLATISRQQQEIAGLRERVEALEAEDVGQLRGRVEELEAWKLQAEEQIRQLEVKAAMTQSLTIFIGISLIALLGEKVNEALRSVDDWQGKVLELAEEKQAELEAEFGDWLPKLLETVRQIDSMSLEAWQRQRPVLERRAATLPPLKRAMYEALNHFASPSKVGTQLVNVLLASGDFSEKLTPDERRKFELLAAACDTFSNIWPLTVTNTLAPMLSYVGYDDAAEAAGEILDQLEATGMVPRNLVHKVRPDLVQMGVIEQRTKPQTIIEYLTQGFQLRGSGYSPDEAADFGHMHSSATQLKRAKRALAGLEELYNRTRDYPGDVNIDQLEDFAQSFKRVAEQKMLEIGELVAIELN